MSAAVFYITQNQSLRLIAESKPPVAPVLRTARQERWALLNLPVGVQAVVRRTCYKYVT